MSNNETFFVLKVKFLESSVFVFLSGSFNWRAVVQLPYKGRGWCDSQQKWNNWWVRKSVLLLGVSNEGFRPEFDLILRPFLLINVQEGLVIRIQLTRRKNSDFLAKIKVFM